MCTLLPDDLHSDLFLFLMQQVLCRVAAVIRLPVHHNSADYILSGTFWIIGLILSQFESKVSLKPVLGVGVGSVATITCLPMNRLNKTESAILFL